MKIPNFNTKKELFDFLIANKSTLEAQKKAVIKFADGVLFLGSPLEVDVKKSIEKAGEDGTSFVVKVAINTTNLLDSHTDVHIAGLWNKSLKENKNIMHLREHKLEFEAIIADGPNLTTYTKNYTFKELGYPELEGNTEALIFESTVDLDRNKFMYDQYRKGYVKNHSVGMQYVKLVLAVNDESYGAEFEAWEKYYPMVANKDVADELGYFWAVKEAKVIEGSAVPIGSNYATPTIEIDEEPDKSTPPKITEPAKATQTINEYLQTFKFFN